MSDRAANRPAVPDLRVTDQRRRMRHDPAALLQHRIVRKIVVTSQRADQQPIAVLADIRQVTQAADVDEQRRPRDA